MHAISNAETHGKQVHLYIVRRDILKVQNIKTAELGLQTVRNAEAHDGGFDKSISFRRALSDLSQEQYEAHLTELVGKIDEQAQKLTKRADIKEFEKYRSLIKEFVDEVVSNGYAYSKDNSFASRGRHRFFATVKTVDQKLEAMAKEVLSGQSDSISLLHQIDDIRGLILDMML